MPGTVSILICTRDRADSLRETLASIAPCRVPPDLAAELVVIDNGSSDHTAQVVREAAARPGSPIPVRHLLEPAPGQTQARNAGLHATTSDVILFTDDDVRVPPDWLEGMCRPILTDRTDAVAGGVHFPPSYEPLLAREPFRSHRGWFASTEGIDPAAPRRMVGANMAFSRRVADTLGEFDTRLGPGALGFYDETLFCWRLLDAGFRLVPAFDTSVEHHFDLSRLTRPTLLNMAQRMGQSEAYISHHWHGDDNRAAVPSALRRARLMSQMTGGLNLWRAWSNTASSEEMQRAQTLAYWEQLATLAGTPRKYRTQHV